jgi:peptide-methionine (R)-S-oxide reductase
MKSPTPTPSGKKSVRPDQYRVLRKAGTETPFTSPLNKEKRTGVYTCAGCALPLVLVHHQV